MASKRVTKRLPIGIQDFATIREGGESSFSYIYVDKTKETAILV